MTGGIRVAIVGCGRMGAERAACAVQVRRDDRVLRGHRWRTCPNVLASRYKAGRKQ